MSELVKDMECATCEHIFKCNGKPVGVSCISYKERENGRQKDDIKQNN